MILMLSFIFLSNLLKSNISNSFINPIKLLIIINIIIFQVFYRLAFNKSYNNNLLLKIIGLLKAFIYVKAKFL